MRTSPSNAPSSPDGRVGIVAGLLGLAAGVAAVLGGSALFGLAAGILALIGPTVMLRGLPGAASDEVANPDEVGSSEDDIVSRPGDAFHMDSELLTAEYYSVAVRTRMTVARRFLKPLAVVQLQVSGDEEAAIIDAHAGTAVTESLRDCDTAYVLGAGHIALVLEDTPENGAVWAVERVRRHLANTHPGLLLHAGIACYPAHGMDAGEVMAQSSDALHRAREWHQDRIEVALAE